MKADNKYDVVIVGAGPAGAFLGYLLALKGVKVLIVDKKAFPRYKACGGGITQRASKVLPFDFSHVVEDETYTAKLLYRDQLLYGNTMDYPIIRMVMRDKFDNYLVEKAVSTGAVFQDQTEFKSLSGRIGDLSVNTTKGIFSTHIVIGADGANTRVAKALDLTLKRDVMVAVEGEVYPDNTDLLDHYMGTAHYDFGVVPEGYGWIFPKKDHLSVGIGSFSGKLKDWKQCFESYLALKKLGLGVRIHPLKGHLIPFRPQKGDILGSPKGLLVGDAAGITDPITGEGIYYAFKGAIFASQVILESLESGYEKMFQYTDLMFSEFLYEMVCANRLSYLLYKFPRFSKKMLELFGEILGKNMIHVITGDQTYAELHDKVFSLKKILSVLFNR